VETFQNSYSAYHRKGSGGRTRLYVEIPCEGCGDPRPVPKHNVHPGLCRRCSYVSRGFSAPKKLTCIGSNPYPTTLPLDRRLHADGCPRKEWVSRKRIKNIQCTIQSWRSEKCRKVVNGIRSQERRVKAFLNEIARQFYSPDERKRFFFEQTAGEKGEGFSPHEAVPRIRSLDRLSELISACDKLGDRIGKEFDPQRFKPGDDRIKSRKKPRKRKDSRSQRAGLLLKYAKRQADSDVEEVEKLEHEQRGKHMRIAGSTVKGICLCGKLVVSAKRGVRVYAQCYQNYSGDKYRKGIPPKPSQTRPGRPQGGSLASLRKRYAWMIRHYAGEIIRPREESYGNIAKEFHVDRSVVEDGIESIKSMLDLDHVSQKIRETWRFLGICP
jgi:hypothetical protein